MRSARFVRRRRIAFAAAPGSTTAVGVMWRSLPSVTVPKRPYSKNSRIDERLRQRHAHALERLVDVGRCQRQGDLGRRRQRDVRSRRPRRRPAVISVMPKNSLTVADDMHLVADGDVEPARGVDEDAVGCRGVAVTRVLQVVAVEAADAGSRRRRRPRCRPSRRRSGRCRPRPARNRSSRRRRRSSPRPGALRGLVRVFSAPGVFSASPTTGVPALSGYAGEIEVVAHPVGDRVGVGAVGDARGTAGERMPMPS